MSIYNFKEFNEILEKKSNKEVDIKTSIRYARIPHELKDVALEHLQDYTKCKKSKISGLRLHKDLVKKIKEKELPSGFDMGIDKNGYYIHTHRARSKSKETPNKITVKEIKFIDSTG